MEDMKSVARTIAEYYNHSRDMLREFREKKKKDEHDNRLMYRFQVESTLLSCLVNDLGISEEVDAELRKLREKR